MISAILDFLFWLLGKLTGKSASQEAAETGEKLGRAEQASADKQASLDSVAAANDAREQVQEQAQKSPGSITQDDGFRRD